MTRNVGMKKSDTTLRCRRGREALKKSGKKAREWAKYRRLIKQRFERAGITGCEVCGTEENLGFAHSLKRRHVNTEELWMEVALLCNTHHDELELQGEAIMAPAIRAIIAGREVRDYVTA